VTAGSPPGYPGEMLGLPQNGPGSLVSMGRRLLALLIDWLISYGLALLVLNVGGIPQTALSTAILVIWFLLGVVSVRLFGFTPGQLALGMQVAAVDGRVPVGLGRLVVRGLLIALIVPALFVDSDGRGLQDQVTRTAVVRR
jgi:uncharacterized RDD family membrane protein YckC